MDLGKASIADRTHSCLERFDILVDALSNHSMGHGDELSLLAVEDQIGRLRLWAGNIGALQEGRSSLDYRLKDAKFIVENIQRLLDSLHVSLIRAIQAVGRQALFIENTQSGSIAIPSDYETSSESSGGGDLGTPVKSELAGYYLAIAEIIRRLFKLSMAIRSPSVQNTTVKSASFIQKDDDGNDLLLLFEQYVLRRITHHYPDLSSILAKRISRAVGRRRRQFLYQRRHREKLGKVRRGEDQLAPPAQNVETSDLNPSIPHGLAVPDFGTDMGNRPEPTVFHQSILSETTATQYVPRSEKPQAPSTKSFSTASGIFQGSEIDIPPPISPDKDQEFECPYCFFILSNEFKEQWSWRKHVFDDLSPYSCLFEDCPNPDQTFSKYNEWVYHEDWSHNLQWCCDLSSHDLQLFDSQAKLEDHLQDVHKESIEDTGIRQLIERNQRPAPILWTECPFCKFVPELADPRDVSAGFSQDELASKKLVKHIGHHLQSISTLALPWRDDLQDDASSELNESAKICDLEAGSGLDAIEVDETAENYVADLKAYEVDLLSVPPTVDQRWNRNPSDFQEIDEDDRIIIDLLLHQNNPLRRYEPPHSTRFKEGEIRLLQLLPGKPSDAIFCSRLVTRLQRPPVYEYLSYAWGSESEDRSIDVNGQPYRVFPDLFDALKTIRRQDSILTIWVDALCINQDDVGDRRSQLTLMPEIVRGASKTIVWLGLSKENSDLAMDFVASGFELITTKGTNIRILNKALFSLFARPWWTRLWVMRDAVFSESAMVTCGSRSVPFESFVALRRIEQTPESLRENQLLVRPTVEMPFGDLLLHWDELKSRIREGTATLFNTMLLTRKLLCASPADKVYAVLGLGIADSKSMTVDYSKPSFQVYTDAMRVFLSSHDVLPLYVVEDNQTSEFYECPSWVIDWSTAPVSRVGLAFDGFKARGAYQSGGRHEDVTKLLKNEKRPADEEDRIFRQGIQIDTIELTGEAFGSAGASTGLLMSLCRRWWSLYCAGVRDLPRVVNFEQAFWRTLVADRLENFAEIPAITLLEDFYDWLDVGLLSFSHVNKNKPSRRVMALIRRSCTSRKFARTSTGRPALVPERAQVGDHICVLLGGDVPFVLRSIGSDWNIIGEAYVHGFMNGEALESVKMGQNKVQAFSIR